MIKHTAMEPINMQTVLLMLVNGTKINNMAKELKNGQMGPSTKATIKMERNMAMAA